mgnify:CR=1 FL=1
MNEQPKFTGYFKIVEPQPDTTKITDNISTDGSAYNNYSWYQRLVHGSSSRISKYQEFDTMDRDVDVARALDLIAEEMTNRDGKTGMRLNIDLQTEEGREIPDSLVATLRVVLKHWMRIQEFDSSLYDVCRNTIKMGDCFFRKQKPTSKWMHLNAKHVLAAVVDAEDATKIVAYQIRSDVKKPSVGNGGYGQQVTQEYETEIVPASEIVRFTLNDDMSDQAPFGLSVLADVYRVQKQKELLEDAIVIYRVQRAPERRVFYVDVGKMPPQRTKQYLEQVKNELRQKKIPSSSGGVASIDSTYNPQSMSEDFFFASRGNGAGTKVETLPAGQNLGELTDLEYFRDNLLRGLRIPPSFIPNFQTGDTAGSFSDGQVGTAYVQEIQFFKFVERLQSKVNATIDLEFKRFAKDIGIKVDESMYTVRLAEPTNYEKYKEAAVDGDLLGQFGNADGVEFLSKRFVMSRYLKMTPEEIATNEMMLRQERGLSPLDGKALVRIYNPDLMDLESPDSEGDDMGGGMGGGLDGGADDGEPLEGDDSDSSITDSADSVSAPPDQSEQ